ncbi:MAG: hypothetical protein CEN91_352 [Candidatus Berkelbacteria bacterium Licking1014_85]|uniref:Prepilin-type N-terminal cleavage/methylation domain-containing protein n=1 Tax=Candidatus Berkelbacteria bacterium Licking1014_85 TaxID=2017148 RepID=A0A554LIZ1_9BACT|nr:MAG: hypothetical protein CEN91_352 [Candidatus Berkelbacteria bacterium Licking1014_85]
MIFFKKQSGFGLVETLVATGILTIVIGATVSLTTMTLKNSSTISNEIVANHLIIEVFEAARQIRNTNYIDEKPGTDWDNGLANGTYGDINIDSLTNKISLIPSEIIINLNNINFSRKCVITDSGDVKTIKCDISWLENTRAKSKTASYILTNYEQDF